MPDEDSFYTSASRKTLAGGRARWPLTSSMEPRLRQRKVSHTPFPLLLKAVCCQQEDVLNRLSKLKFSSAARRSILLPSLILLTCQQAFADAAQLMALIELLPDLLGAGLPLL